MHATFILHFLLLALFTFKILNQSYCRGLTDVDVNVPYVNRDLVRESDAITLLNISLDAKNSKVLRQSIRQEGTNIKFDTVCNPNPTLIDEPDMSLQRIIFHPLLKMMDHMRDSSLGDRSGASQDATLLGQLVESNWTERGYASVYDIIRGAFGNAARKGLFLKIEETNTSEPESFYKFRAYHEERSIVGHAVASVPDYYYKSALGPSNVFLPCPFIRGYPISWFMSDPDVKSGIRLDVIAVPAMKKDGSFQIISPQLNLTTVSTANELFLKQNNWTVGKIPNSPFITKPEGTQSVIKTNLTQFVVKAPPDVINCTSHYSTSCRTYGSTPRDSLCTQWKTLCGVQNIIKLPNPSENGTHMLYIPSKTYGGNFTGSDYRFNRLILNYRNSQRTALSLSQSELSEAMDSMQQTETIYLPKLEADQDLLTLVVIFLVFFSEWIFSTPLLVEVLWTRLMRFGPYTSALNTEREQSDYEEMKKKFKGSCTLLLPALMGFIPLPLGLHQAAERKNAVVGLMAAGWAADSYQAFDDPELESLGLSKGRTLSLRVEYREHSMFDNLFRHYLIATCLAAALLLCSFVALFLQGRAFLRERAKKKLSEDNSHDEHNSHNEDNWQDEDKEPFMTENES